MGFINCFFVVICFSGFYGIFLYIVFEKIVKKGVKFYILNSSFEIFII